MIDANDRDLAVIEQLRRRIARTAYGVVAAGLAGGVALYFARQQPASMRVLASAVCILLALPLVNVLAVLAGEVRRRDWAFVWLAGGVLALLGYAIVSQVIEAGAFGAP